MAPPKRALPKLLPKNPSSSDGQGTQAGPSLNVDLPRKRRAVALACEGCRKRRIKCDGVRPQCGSCEVRDQNCIFNEPAALDQAEREQLTKYQSVIELLHQGSAAESAQALQRIRQSSHSDDAISSIAAARLLLPAPSSAVAATTAAASSSKADNTEAPRGHGFIGREKRRLLSPHEDSSFMFETQYLVDARDRFVNGDFFIDVSARNRHLPLSRWTAVSSDDELMGHLLNMFFTWDNVVERTLYRPILEEDIAAMNPQAASSQPGSFCTRFLVSALLAASCLYTMDPITFKDSGDSSSRGRLWADEAESLLKESDKPSITLLQGLYCLFVYEGNIGIGTKALKHFLRSMDVYKALNNSLDELQYPGAADEERIQREKQAISWCMWGVYCCEWRSSQALGFRKLAQKPKVTKAWRSRDFPLLQPHCVGYWWSAYPMSHRMQKSMQVEVREVDVLLSEMAEDALDFLFPGEGNLPPVASPQRCLEIYDAFIDWKLSLPSRLRLEDAILPSTILLHIVLEVMLTAMLRPFSHMTKEQFGRFDPRQRCFTHACSLMSIIWTFRAFCQIRLEYYLVHPLGSAAYIVLGEAEDAPARMDVLVRACQCLHEMKVSLPLAIDVLSGIRAAFLRYKLPVPAFMKKYFESLQHRKDGLMHHTVASLLPSSIEAGRTGSGEEFQLQQLLDGFDSIDID
ncbi:fungal-specific transcription factor [Dactylonectria macrodidyma]|uniref:Fungal-specific transcription factor n=1 Tax=Dactylonectria macrodidyma TaxID=307937 RepID=A0A9P9DXY9_9HYPO|nr:fungal-specific transcription factor [Dactylonectria macrodidyma]